MPLSLYEKRISQLEAAADHSTSGSVEVEAFFCEANEDLEDSVLVSYTGTVVEYNKRPMTNCLILLIFQAAVTGLYICDGKEKDERTYQVLGKWASQAQKNSIVTSSDLS